MFRERYDFPGLLHGRDSSSFLRIRNETGRKRSFGGIERTLDRQEMIALNKMPLFTCTTEKSVPGTLRHLRYY